MKTLPGRLRRNSSMFAAAIIGGLIIGLMALPSFRATAQKKSSPPSKSDPSGDTSKPKPTSYALSKAQLEMSQEAYASAQEGLKVALAELKQLDLEKPMKELEEAMRKLDAKALAYQIDAALKSVDGEKLAREVTQALQQIDSEKLRAEVAAAIKSADIEAALAKVKIGFSAVEQLEMEKALSQLKTIDLPNAQKAIADARKQIAEQQVQLKLAAEQFKAASAKMELQEAMRIALEKEGLITPNQAVEIEYKDGVLFIDNKPQSKEISEKYKSYFQNANGKIRVGAWQ